MFIQEAELIKSLLVLLPIVLLLPHKCVRKNLTAGSSNDIKNLGVIRYHPEIEDVIRAVGVAPLDLPTDDQITHTVADIVLAVNDEHYSVLYLGTGTCVCVCARVRSCCVFLCLVDR